MAKNPSSIWYWNDWMVDPAVRSCSMAAQGMWMQMLGIAAAADGYVQVGDKPCSTSDLARITGQDKRNVCKWVHELDRKGVFSRTEDGTIFCRRMRREAEARAAKRANGGAKLGQKKASGRHPIRATNQPDLHDNPEPKPQNDATPDSDSVAVSQNPLPTSKPLPLLNAARARAEKDEHNKKEYPEEGRCAPLAEPAAVPQPEMPATNQTPARVVLAGANRDGLKANAGRCRTGTAKGESDAETSPTPATDHRHLAHPRQADGAPLAGRWSTATTRLAASPGRAPKSPALKAKIRDLLTQKHARFLIARRRPDELAAYWAGLLNPDPKVAQQTFDETDRRMRCANWDDMRQWKAAAGLPP